MALPSLLGLAQSPGPEEQAPVVCSPASHSGRASLTPSFFSVELYILFLLYFYGYLLFVM